MSKHERSLRTQERIRRALKRAGFIIADYSNRQGLEQNDFQKLLNVAFIQVLHRARVLGWIV